MGKINLEKLTRDELLYLFKANEWRMHGVNFDSQLRRYKIEKEWKKRDDALKESIDAGQELADWLEQRRGVKLSDLSPREVAEGARLERKLKAADKKYLKLSASEREGGHGKN